VLVVVIGGGAANSEDSDGGHGNSGSGRNVALSCERTAGEAEAMVEAMVEAMAEAMAENFGGYGAYRRFM
jgi:hypothetical protein